MSFFPSLQMKSEMLQRMYWQAVSALRMHVLFHMPFVQKNCVPNIDHPCATAFWNCTCCSTCRMLRKYIYHVQFRSTVVFNDCCQRTTLYTLRRHRSADREGNRHTPGRNRKSPRTPATPRLNINTDVQKSVVRIADHFFFRPLKMRAEVTWSRIFWWGLSIEVVFIV